MRSLSVQVLTERSPGMDLAGLSAAFRQLAMRADLVDGHSFDSGYDNGAYYNFTFGTNNARELWLVMWESIFEDPKFRSHLALSAMAVCSSNHGWDDYVQLCHWDASVSVASLEDL